MMKSFGFGFRQQQQQQIQQQQQQQLQSPLLLVATATTGAAHEGAASSSNNNTNPAQQLGATAPSRLRARLTSKPVPISTAPTSHSVEIFPSPPLETPLLAAAELRLTATAAAAPSTSATMPNHYPPLRRPAAASALGPASAAPLVVSSEADEAVAAAATLAQVRVANVISEMFGMSVDFFLSARKMSPLLIYFFPISADVLLRLLHRFFRLLLLLPFAAATAAGLASSGLDAAGGDEAAAAAAAAADPPQGLKAPPAAPDGEEILRGIVFLPIQLKLQTAPGQDHP